MSSDEPAKKPATELPNDRGEASSLMEPMLVREPQRRRDALADLAVNVVGASAALRSSLPPGIVPGLADLVRAMNCYYSNLIEGHDTHPLDIERALRNDYSQDSPKRNLQLEARAHVEVQAWIDAGGVAGRATTQSATREIHRRFCSLLPDDLLWITNPDGARIQVHPGEYRTTNVAVGRHVAISPGAVPRFMERFEEVYGGLGAIDSIVAAATAHHRLLWIHPFTDGNGRVARLMSHAMLRDALDTGGIWSIARGLARREADYKDHLGRCDEIRHGDLDGRGNLSAESLADFADFFLQACLDQITFMSSLVQPDRLRHRVVMWAQDEIRKGTLPPHALAVVESLLNRGEVPRGDIPMLASTSDRTARRITAALQTHGVVTSASPRAPLRFAFPTALAPQWMPGLFPDSAGTFQR
jgi:Fic family protein